MLNDEQLQIQRLVTHYNTYGRKTNSDRNNELLDILLTIGSSHNELDILEGKNKTLYLQFAKPKSNVA